VLTAGTPTLLEFVEERSSSTPIPRLGASVESSVRVVETMHGTLADTVGQIIDRLINENSAASLGATHNERRALAVVH